MARLSQQITNSIERARAVNRRDPPPREQLVTPGNIRRSTSPRPWEGSLERKPWHFEVSAVIPHCNTPDLLRLCIALLRAQSIPVYVIVVDTGTEDRLLPEVLAQRDIDVEVQQVNVHGTRHSAGLVSMAMDVGQAVCQTEWMLTVHSDCLITNRDLVESWMEQLKTAAWPCIGYRSIPREHVSFWKKMVSHTCTLWHLPTLDDLDVTWGVRRLRRKMSRGGASDGIGGQQFAGAFDAVETEARTDTEVLANQMLLDAGYPPIIVGDESWDRIERDENRIHLRSYTAAVIHHHLPDRFVGELRQTLTELVAMASSYGYPLPDEVAGRMLGMGDFSLPGTHLIEGKAKAISPEAHAAYQNQPEPALLPSLDDSEAAPPSDGELIVTFIAPIWNYYPVLMESLANQDYPHWRLLLYHDGPIDQRLQRRIAANKDGRTTLVATDMRFQDWGHSLREIGINQLAKGASGDWVVVTNGDNYYVPGFCAAIAKAARERPEAVAIHCDMLHNYWGWKSIRTALAHCEIDCGAVAVRRDAAIAAGFPGRHHAADFAWLKAIAERWGIKNFVKIDGSMFVHN